MNLNSPMTAYEQFNSYATGTLTTNMLPNSHQFCKLPIPNESTATIIDHATTKTRGLDKMESQAAEAQVIAVAKKKKTQNHKAGKEICGWRLRSIMSEAYTSTHTVHLISNGTDAIDT